MRFLADLHVHSRWSRATGKDADLRGFHLWARRKGISLVGTGDLTHPKWMEELRESLEPEDGLFRLKDPPTDPLAPQGQVRFCLTGEISSIYKKKGATRKVHSVIALPSFESALRLNARLSTVGNIASDGRPILGLDPKDLLAMVLDASPEGFLIPAHVWTPWFSLFGSKSGFNAIEECFEDLTPEVFALETGLSSDPPMNRLWSGLDRFRLVSNSDAHSPPNLGREANLLDAEMSYGGLLAALRTGTGFLGTVEFYPEEGKYHLDGHRLCGVAMDPAETRRRGEACPVCGKPLTIGVLNRVLELADRDAAVHPRPAEGFRYLIPLRELLGEVADTGSGSKAVDALYEGVLRSFGAELPFLLDAPLADIGKACGTLLEEAVRRMREGRVTARAGFDGQFGVIRVFAEGERERLAGQDDLFGRAGTAARRPAARRSAKAPAATAGPAGIRTAPQLLDDDQGNAVLSDAPATLVSAGPGTGKTRVLTGWIARLVSTEAARPEEILAVTFTNRAAAEMRERLRAALGARADGISVDTFHGFCHSLLASRENSAWTILDARGRERLLRMTLPADGERKASAYAARIERVFEGVEEADGELLPVIEAYRKALKGAAAFDLSALVYEAALLLREDPALLADLRGRLRFIAVDELQDINAGQYRLLELLAAPPGDAQAGPRRAMFCIGDPDQAVYSFRGSDLSLFYRFRDGQGAAWRTLGKSYRSTGVILEAASAVIARAAAWRPVSLEPVRERGRPITVFRAQDPLREGDFIARTVEALSGGLDSRAVGGGGREARDHGAWSFADVAVLFRARSVRDALIPVFRSARIPFTLREASPLDAEEPMRTVFALLRVLSNPGDAVSRLDAVELLSGVPLRGGAGAAVMGAADGQATAFALHGLADRGILPRAAAAKAEAFFLRVDKLRASIPAEGVVDLIDGLLAAFRASGDPLPEGQAPSEAAADASVEAVREMAREHGPDLAGFLRRAALSDREGGGGLKAEKVRLLTFHAAKGLEFPVVFIAGAEEGLAPLAGADPEEERRLFYVALTRARDRLFLSHCEERRIFGRTQAMKASRFLADIPAECVERSVLHTPRKPRDRSDGQLPLF